MENNKNQIQQPLPNHVYGNIMYWLSIISAAICTLAPVFVMTFPERNVLNPLFLFPAIWEGAKPQVIWQRSEGGFPGAHFWINHITYGDGMIQFGVALGCFSAGIALLATTIAYIKQKPRNYVWALLSLIISIIIILATLGIYQQAE